MILRKICQCFCLAALLTTVAQAQTICTVEQLTDSLGDNPVFQAAIDDESTTVLVNTSGSFGTGGNPDGGLDLFLFDIASSTFSQITEGPFGHQVQAMSIAASGTRSVFSSRIDPVGMNADGSTELFLWDAGTVTQVTDNPSSFFTVPAISGDGSAVAFMSTVDLVGMNPDGSFEFFLLDLGTNTFQQLTNATASPAGSYEVVVNHDASVVVISSPQDYLGTNPDESPEIFVWNGSLQQVTSSTLPDQAFSPTVAADEHISFIWTADPFGTNPDLGSELFSFTPSTNVLSQITNSPENSSTPSLSDNGERVFFSSRGDLVGSNGDSSEEVFFYDFTDDTFTQVTMTTGANSTDTQADGDGDTVVFFSTFDHVGTNPDQNTEMFLARCVDTMLPPTEIPTQSSVGLLLLVVLLAWVGFRRLTST